MAQADTCKKLEDCIQKTEKLLDIKFFYGNDLIPKGRELNQEITLTKENAHIALSEALEALGFAKVPSLEKGKWQIINSRDIRHHGNLPVITADKKSRPAFAQGHDPVKLIYYGVPGSSMEKIMASIEPLLSRHGRITPMREGVMVINDKASHLSKILPVIQSQDSPLTKDEKAAMILEKKREHELEIIRAKSGHRHDIFPKGSMENKNHEH